MINPDLPITKSSEDKLNRGSFANSLANVLIEYSAPYSFSIGLYGEWGSGKTSLLNMVLETVEERDKDVVVLRFNPWLCSDPNQLITQFFKQMAAAIKLKKPTGDRVWELIDQYGDVLDATSLIPVAGQALSTAGKAATNLAKRRVAQKANDLQGSKDKIIAKLSADNTKIIVAIDDIDRLSDEEIISVFQLVKALADFPNTIYLLAFDYQVVINALSKVQHGDGEEYLEKVIQVPFKIPAPNMHNIEEILFAKLNDILSDVPEKSWDKYTWNELYQYGVKKYIGSIRDVIRFVNVFHLKYELLKEETNPVDLLGLTCLQVFEPLLYAKLTLYKESLCGGSRSYSFSSEKEETEKIARVVESLFPKGDSVKNENAAKQILRILFPRVKDSVGIHIYSGRYYNQSVFLLSNSIAAPECFDRYFSLMLEDDAIPTSIIKQLFFNASEEVFKAYCALLYQQGKIVRLLEELDAYVGNGEPNALSPERAKIILKCLTELWHTFVVDDTGFLTMPFHWRLPFCADHLLGKIPQVNRCDFLKELFNNSAVQPSTLSLLLDDLERAHGRFKEDAVAEDNPLISLDEVVELEKIFRTRAISALDSREVLEQNNGLSFFWLLGKIDPDLASEKKKSFVTGTKSLIKVLDICFSRGVATTGRASYKTWGLNEDALAEFIDPQEAYKQFTELITTDMFFSLDVGDQMDVVAFLLIMEEAEAAKKENGATEGAITRRLQEITAEHISGNKAAEAEQPNDD